MKWKTLKIAWQLYKDFGDEPFALCWRLAKMGFIPGEMCNAYKINKSFDEIHKEY